jgi:hypothetical protein
MYKKAKLYEKAKHSQHKPVVKSDSEEGEGAALGGGYDDYQPPAYETSAPTEAPVYPTPYSFPVPTPYTTPYPAESEYNSDPLESIVESASSAPAYPTPYATELPYDDVPSEVFPPSCSIFLCSGVLLFFLLQVPYAPAKPADEIYDMQAASANPAATTNCSDSHSFVLPGVLGACVLVCCLVGLAVSCCRHMESPSPFHKIPEMKTPRPSSPMRFHPTIPSTPPLSVEMQMRLRGELSKVSNRGQFIQDFKNALAQAFGIEPTRLDFFTLIPGSIIVKFNILKKPGESNDELLQLATRMMDTRKLLSSTFFREYTPIGVTFQATPTSQNVSGRGPPPMPLPATASGGVSLSKKQADRAVETLLERKPRELRRAIARNLKIPPNPTPAKGSSDHFTIDYSDLLEDYLMKLGHDVESIRKLRRLWRNRIDPLNHSDDNDDHDSLHDHDPESTFNLLTNGPSTPTPAKDNSVRVPLSAVDMKMKLKGDLSSIGSHDKFKHNFKNALAQQHGIQPSRLVDVSVSSGSIIVKFKVLKKPGESNDELLRLATKMTDTRKLLQGKGKNNTFFYKYKPLEVTFQAVREGEGGGAAASASASAVTEATRQGDTPYPYDADKKFHKVNDAVNWTKGPAGKTTGSISHHVITATNTNTNTNNPLVPGTDSYGAPTSRVGDVQWNKKPGDDGGAAYGSGISPQPEPLLKPKPKPKPTAGYGDAKPLKDYKEAIKPTKQKCEASKQLCPPADMYNFRCPPFSDPDGNGNGKDPSFMPCLTSVGKDPKWDDDAHRCIWKRCGDLGLTKLWEKDPSGHAIDPGDINQGQLGDCWLLSSISCLAEFESAVQDLFVTKEYNPSGTYTLCLFGRHARALGACHRRRLPAMPREGRCRHTRIRPPKEFE